MRYLKLSAVFLLLALAMICFVAGPAISGDTDAHPWDGDEETGKDLKDADTGGDSGGNTDTLVIVNTFNTDDPDGTTSGGSFLSDVWNYSAFFISNLLYTFQPESLDIFITSSPSADQNEKAD